MKIDKISLKGFTVFRNEATLDLAALGPGLIAIAGPNGAGKSTVLESIPGCLYREAPSYGSISEIATARDSRIELIGENGTPFIARLDVDNVNGKMEAILFNDEGEPLGGPKVREFDKAIAEHFPPLSVYLAAAFACQTGAGSLLKIDRAERRALFGRLLGLERIELMATAARDEARQVETELSSIRAALAAVKEGSIEAGELEIVLVEAKERAARASEFLAQVRDQLRGASAECDRLAAARIEAQRAEKAVQEARQRADRLAQEADKVRRDLGALDAILSEAAAIRWNAAEIVALSGELDEMRTRGEAAAAEERKAVDELARAERASSEAEKAELAAGASIIKANELYSDLTKRIEAAEKATEAVPCAGALAEEVRSECSALSGHFRIQKESEKKLEALQHSLPELQAAADRATKVNAGASQKVELAAKCAGQARMAAEGIRLEYRKISNKLTDLKAKDRSSQLDRAEAEAGALRDRLKAVNDQAVEAKAAADRAAAECPKVDNAKILEAEAVAKKVEGTLNDSMLSDQQAQRAVARLETQVDAAKAAEAKAAELEARISPLDRNLADWRFLARGLGREGVQALELDAAGPRVSALANELLADAYGPRFQVRFETQAAKADGKGVKETFDIVVVDNEKGREGNGQDFSGGEKVIIGEALGLAVGLFHAQSAGISLGTVVRDETVGALDPENGERYISMLRGFLKLGHVHQLLYVAHQPALIDLADAVVRIENGRIEVKA